MATAARRFVVGSVLVLGLGLAWGRPWVWQRLHQPDALPADHGAGFAVRGRVVGPDGAPLAAARVTLKGTASTTLSGRAGEFRLPAAGPSGTVTAALDGYFIGGTAAAQRTLQIALAPLPATDAADYEWVDPTPDPASPQNCGNCHEQIFNEWHASGHAAGNGNRRLMNLYAGTDWQGRSGHGWSLLDEHPDGAAVCASCHVPAAPLDDPRFDDLRTVQGVAAGGVQCDFCHKVAQVAVDRVGFEHGRFAMRLLRPDGAAGGAQIFFGPLADVDRGEDVYSPLQGSSRYCAACHEGTVFGVPVYSTYSEWLASPAAAAGRQCQACHMRPNGQMHNVAPGAGGSDRDPQTLASHELLPGGRLGMLRRALQLTARVVRGAERQTLEVKLWADDVGHRVPTGFVDRHLILLVEARDADGQSLSLAEGPRIDAAAGPPLAHQPGRLWAKLLSDTAGDHPVPFWRAGATPRDNRLVPGEPDISRYGLPHAARRVRLRLWYRRFWQQVATEKQWPADELAVFDQSYELAAGSLRPAEP